MHEVSNRKKEAGSRTIIISSLKAKKLFAAPLQATTAKRLVRGVQFFHYHTRKFTETSVYGKDANCPPVRLSDCIILDDYIILSAQNYKPSSSTFSITKLWHYGKSTTSPSSFHWCKIRLGSDQFALLFKCRTGHLTSPPYIRYTIFIWISFQFVKLSCELIVSLPCMFPPWYSKYSTECVYSHTSSRYLRLQSQIGSDLQSWQTESLWESMWRKIAAICIPFDQALQANYLRFQSWLVSKTSHNKLFNSKNSWKRWHHDFYYQTI